MKEFPHHSLCYKSTMWMKIIWGCLKYLPILLYTSTFFLFSNTMLNTYYVCTKYIPTNIHTYILLSSSLICCFPFNQYKISMHNLKIPFVTPRFSYTIFYIGKIILSEKTITTTNKHVGCQWIVSAQKAKPKWMNL